MAFWSGAVPGAGIGTNAAGDPRTAGQSPDAAFQRSAPLVLDLGCGNGLFLAALAACEPDWNILGIEKKDHRVRQARRRAGHLPNVRVMKGGVMAVIGALPADSVARVYLLFGDPWPKRRHAGRRLVQPEFVRLLSSRLTAEGSCFFASDSGDYADWAEDVFCAGGWRVAPWAIPPDWPATEFEQRFVSAGVQIRRFEAKR